MADEKKKKVNPRRLGRLDIDWDMAEQFFIMGELVTQHSDGTMTQKLPSYRDVARRFNCSSQLVGNHSKKSKWKEKREIYRRQASAKLREEVAKARAMSFAEAACILDAWLVQFQDQLQKRKVRTDALSDFNIAMRLKRFVDDQPQPDAGSSDGISLEKLQRKHRKARKARADIEQTAGVLPTGDPSGVLAGEGDSVH